MRKILIAIVLAPLCAWAAEQGYRLDRAPNDPRDLVSLQAGASGTATVTVTGSNGFNSGVTLSASGLPSGVTAPSGIG